MKKLLAALIKLAERGGEFTLAHAYEIRDRVLMKVIFILLACLTSFALLAAFSWTTQTFVLAIVLSGYIAYLGTDPAHLSAVAGAGLAAKLANMRAELVTEIKEVFREWLVALQWAILLLVTFLFFSGSLVWTGLVSFHEHPENVFIALTALIVIGLLLFMWPEVFPGARGRRFVFGYSVSILILSVLGCTGPVWVKYTGWDPSTIKPTSTEEALYRLNHVRQEMADADRAKELERITQKIRRREALTGAEERFIAEVQSQSERKPKQQQHATSAKECAKSHPCALSKQEDGSTEKVTVPEGKQVCFDSSSWDNRSRLGYRTSYQGGPEEEHTCTKEQVISGACHEPRSDAFRFVPEAGVIIPRYWFVPEGATQC